MKAIKHHFPGERFIMPCKVVLPIQSMDQIQNRHNSNGSYWAVFSNTAMRGLYHGCHFWVCGWSHASWPFKRNQPNSTLLWSGDVYYAVPRWFYVFIQRMKYWSVTIDTSQDCEGNPVHRPSSFYWWKGRREKPESGWNGPRGRGLGLATMALLLFDLQSVSFCIDQNTRIIHQSF